MSRAIARCMFALALALACHLSLHGCGQTGALYLPGQAQQTPVPAPDDDDTVDESEPGAEAEADSDRAPR